MSITNYGELKTSIRDWLKRKDLTSIAPDLIVLGEMSLRDGVLFTNPRGDVERLALRVRSMETLKTYSPGDSDTDAATADDVITQIDVPSDYLEPKYIMHGTDDVERASPQAVKAARDIAATPTLFYRERDKVYFGPTPVSTNDVTMNYYADFTGALSGDSDTNDILTNYPNLYLYAALCAAEPYLMNDGRAATWKGLLQEGIKAANDRDKAEDRSGGRKRMGRSF